MSRSRGFESRRCRRMIMEELGIGRPCGLENRCTSQGVLGVRLSLPPLARHVISPTHSYSCNAVVVQW